MVWLIGNKGMLGTEVEELLIRNKIRYIASDIDIDITDFDSIDTFIRNKKIKWIINCSAYTNVDKAEDEPDVCYRINKDGVRNIAAAAKKIGAALIHISTDYVFDGRKEGEWTEEDIPLPLSVYGKSKLAGEEEIKRIIDDYFIIRTAWLYGKNGKNFVYTMIRLFKERDVVKVVNDQFGTPTYTEDLALLILRIIREESQKFGIFHFTNDGGKISWYQFAEAIYHASLERNIIDKTKKIDLIPIKTDEYPSKAVRPENSWLSNKKIKTVFQCVIPDWKNGLERFLDKVKGSV